MEPTIGGVAEVDAKVARVRAHLAQTGLGGVLVGRQDNFAWLTGGRDNHVVAGTEAGFGWLLVTPDARFALANRIEAGRLRDEEIGDQGWEWRTYDWYRDGALDAAVRGIAGDATVASDTPGMAGALLGRDFDDLRADLLPQELARYRVLGRLATDAMVETCRTLRPGQREHEIAADLSRRVRAHGARPNVVLIAADDRIARHRHPIPTDTAVREQVMLVLGAVRWGLHVSITRFVAFRPLSADLRRKWDDVSRIAAYFIVATRPGRAWADVFRGAVECYRDLGWPGEWELHHQGGPTGYRARDFVATPDAPGVVSPHQAAAWNPSITGTKSEDTIVVDAAGHELLTRHGEWPMLTVEHDGRAHQLPDVLVR